MKPSDIIKHLESRTIVICTRERQAGVMIKLTNGRIQHYTPENNDKKETALLWFKVGPVDREIKGLDKHMNFIVVPEETTMNTLDDLLMDCADRVRSMYQNAHENPA